MQYQIESEPVYYHVLQGSPLLFADERCKKKMLDLVFDQYHRLGWRLYAFCVTDHAVYMLTVTAGHTFQQDYLQRAADVFLQWCALQGNIYTDGSRSLQSHIIGKLTDMDAIIQYCCRIHRIPVREGYSERMEDYWWSSYNTYMGRHVWSMIDCHAVFFYFSMNSVLARSRFRKFHDLAEKPVLYETKYKNKNDAARILLKE